MPDIKDPQATLFLNGTLRPLCETIRAVQARIDDAKVQYDLNLQAIFAGDGLVDDGRAGEGVSQLDAADVKAVMSVLTDINAAYNAEIITKPCVRPLEAS